MQNDTAWTYDDQGRVTRETNELGDSRNYVYDAAGDLLRYVDANGAVRQYVYDAAHRVVGETWYAGLADADAGQNALNEVEYAYDSAGRLIYEADNYASLAYVYDPENRWIGRDIDLDGDGVIDRQTRFVYDGNQIVLQFEKEGTGDSGLGAGDLSHRYLWQPDAVDQLMADEQVADIEEPCDVLFALTDHLGTVHDLAAYGSASGETTVTNHFTYDAYEMNWTYSLFYIQRIGLILFSQNIKTELSECDTSSRS